MILTRRHLRSKVMQSLFAMQLSKNADLEAERKLLSKSIDGLNGLFVANLSFLMALRAHADFIYTTSQTNHIPLQTKEKSPSFHIKNNKVLEVLNHHPKLSVAIEKYKVDFWELDTKYVSNIYEQLIEEDFFIQYAQNENKDFKTDRKFVIDVFTNLVAHSPTLYQYFEDCDIAWASDFPVANSMTLHFLEKLKSITEGVEEPIPSFIKDKTDLQFAIDLFQKTKLHEVRFEEAVAKHATKWDLNRIAPLDKIIICMGICELLHFPSIPTKVTLNEYIEISKDFSTPKSNVFINGLLHQLSKEYAANGEMQKMGRGLL